MFQAAVFLAIADDGIGERRIDAGKASQLPGRARVDVHTDVSCARGKHSGQQLDGGESLGDLCRHHRSIVVSAMAT